MRNASEEREKLKGKLSILAEAGGKLMGANEINMEQLNNANQINPLNDPRRDEIFPSRPLKPAGMARRHAVKYNIITGVESK